MNELVNMVVEKTGIPATTAQTIVKMIVDFLKLKLPALGLAPHLHNRAIISAIACASLPWIFFQGTAGTGASRRFRDVLHRTAHFAVQAWQSPPIISNHCYTWLP